MCQSKFGKFKKNYHGYKVIYTDESKILNRVGATATTDENYKQIGLPDNAAIYTG